MHIRAGKIWCLLFCLVNFGQSATVTSLKPSNGIDGLLSDFERFLWEKKPWKIDLGDGLGLEIVRDEGVSVRLRLGNDTARKLKLQVDWKKVAPYMVIPGFLMAGFLPWIVPGLKMMVMGVAMMNQMAFNASFFTFVRTMVFDTSKEEHIVYVNPGYKNKPHRRYKRKK